MESSVQEQDIEEALLASDIDGDNTDSNLSRGSLPSTSSFGSKYELEPNKMDLTQRQECEQNVFNSDPDLFEDIRDVSESSGNLELDSIVQQLENGNFTDATIQDKSLKSVDESNLSNADTNLELDEVRTAHADTRCLGAFAELGMNKASKEDDIIELINRELHDTLQFTDVLCHYIYSDVIKGKDFFQLFCSSDNLGDKPVLTDMVEDVAN